MTASGRNREEGTRERRRRRREEGCREEGETAVEEQESDKRAESGKRSQERRVEAGEREEEGDSEREASDERGMERRGKKCVHVRAASNPCFLLVSTTVSLLRLAGVKGGSHLHRDECH